MDLFNRRMLRSLAQTQGDPCISLFLPTVRFQSDQQQNPIRYKNVLKQAAGQLKTDGLPEEAIDALLEPAKALLGDSSYWREMSDGLAVFLTPDKVQFFRLPVNFEELVVTGERFHLTPLFPLVASNNRFYLLALSKNRVRLFQGTHFAISEVEAREIPESLFEAVTKFEDTEEQIQYHTVNRAGGREDLGIHGHGHAPDSDDAKHQPHDRLQRFFRKINNGVQQVLEDEEAPLVLAGVEYYLPIYREVNDYQFMIEDAIVAGSPDRLHPKELHEKAWEVIGPHFQQSQREAAERFHRQMGSDGLASTDLHEIIPASIFSRVDTLFVPIGRHRWGQYNADTNAVKLHGEQEAGDEDLLNVATTHVYLNGGAVHAVRPENMPIEGELAATFRYPADVAATEA